MQVTLGGARKQVVNHQSEGRRDELQGSTSHLH
jgi:hypothetical protein